MRVLQAGLHQLIMQQTYTALPQGAQAPFGQQLGLSASWLGHAAVPHANGGDAGAALAGFEAFSSLHQQMNSQLAEALPGWAALLQPAAGTGAAGTLPAQAAIAAAAAAPPLPSAPGSSRAVAPVLPGE